MSVGPMSETEFYRCLREMFDDRKLTARQIAREIDVSIPTVWRWLKGQNSPATGALRRIAIDVLDENLGSAP